ncbi:family 78 glycoside hydrolase catalytic domain [Nissabacter sp. SGAir0207]|uniref:alpha-L-rhamnosidase-related protein n=1 Tax=Nissabacter sp. SGAir0207 TaxID=2126321 RepID=UPI0010CD2D2D|nr:family 78 glycoside hydrolase catalytic domain [Nissabacter sp. SGAir0207]QCR35686.1 sugar hydrolase [Nissabacter sp. SGAir0207]
MAEQQQHHSIIKTLRHPDLLAQAEALRPALHRQPVSPVALVDGRGQVIGQPADLARREFGPGEEVILDFGTHCVGRLSLRAVAVGSPPDAPAHLHFTFGEIIDEVVESLADYDGWLSTSWFQQQDLYLDVLPAEIALPRRYCCRYVKIRVVATSRKYRLRLESPCLTTETSADGREVATPAIADPLLRQIDAVSVLTLKNCMQEVFEDGPKRDRRLWLGDLRLQARVNYATFANQALVRRCLMLFAGVTREDGMVAANVFIQPEVIADDTYLFDYSLFFVATLADYVAATDDEETLQALWPTAWRQVELALARLDSRGIVQDSDSWWSFIDWHEQLNKQAASQGVLIYALERAHTLAGRIAPARQAELAATLARLRAATLAHLWDEAQGFFTSGAARQVSSASQVWLLLAEVGDAAFRRRLLTQLRERPPAIGMRTPYMVHHYVEALLQHGERQAAVAEIKGYWGEMVARGADTFWELFDPANPDYSPYGSRLINSYCHAWSCTPAWLIRTFQL